MDCLNIASKSQCFSSIPIIKNEQKGNKTAKKGKKIANSIENYLADWCIQNQGGSLAEVLCAFLETLLVTKYSSLP
jgi:hypothetical protein